MATRIVRNALRDSGIELVGSCTIEAYDKRAPTEFRSSVLMPSARGLIVAASAGPALWAAFRTKTIADPTLWTQPQPYDTFVASVLARADAALTRERVAFRRFDAAFHAPIRIDFIAIAQLVGLGSPSPFRLLIHDEHGPWWALRGAWLVDVDVDPPLAHRPPCVGCAAPCIGGWATLGRDSSATPEVRARCVVGQGSRYTDEQIAFHYEGTRPTDRLTK
jgi:epoxyqueuosine reductase QueG